MKRLIVGLLMGIFLLVGCVMTFAEDPKVLRWALIPAEEAALEMELFEPIGRYLEEQLGIPVEMTISSDYTAVVQAIKFGHAEMARFGPFNYVLATTQTKVEALVRGIKKSTGKDAYYSLIITQRYSDIETLEDLKDRTFAFVDPASTSGGLVPTTALIKAGVDPETDLAERFYAGSHGAVIIAVREDKVDAGAIADNRLLDAIEAGVIRESEIVIIYRSEPICNSPIAVRSDLSESLKQRIKEVFLNMPRDLSLNYGTKCLGFVEAKDEDYNPIREIAKTLKLDLTKK